MHLPFEPPLEPMLAKLADALPQGDGWLFEPKWDGFRTIAFRDGDSLLLQSRDQRPLNRYFPELEEPIRRQVPARCVLDGEIVIAGPRGLDFTALTLRIHPAASRVALLAQETPASIVFWDLLAEGDEDLRGRPLRERRGRLERALSRARAPVHVTPASEDRARAADWFGRFEGAGLDGVVAKRLDERYQPGVRAMLKVKHQRTADCAVAGFRWHKGGRGVAVGSLLLGLYDRVPAPRSDLRGVGGRVLHHVGVCSGFSSATQRQLHRELEPLREGALEHPWRDWQAASATGQRLPGATSRWNRGKDLSWEPLRIERVCEVAYDHMEGDRFRHATHFLRWRPDRRPEDCRFDQLEETPPEELARIFGGG